MAARCKKDTRLIIDVLTPDACARIISKKSRAQKTPQEATARATDTPPSAVQIIRHRTDVGGCDGVAFIYRGDVRTSLRACNVVWPPTRAGFVFKCAACGHVVHRKYPAAVFRIDGE